MQQALHNHGLSIWRLVISKHNFTTVINMQSSKQHINLLHPTLYDSSTNRQTID